MERMQAERDFLEFQARFFTTSQVGEQVPQYLRQWAGIRDDATLGDAADIDALRQCAAIITCQGTDYTKSVLPKLRLEGWKGYWIDAASHKRMETDTIIVLPPVNARSIEQGFRDGVLNYAGGNCTVSLMLLALGGLFEAGEVEWLSSMTYQAASGAGARHMQELAEQMGGVWDAVSDLISPTGRGALLPGQHLATAIDAQTTLALRGGGQTATGVQVQPVPVSSWPAPLAGSLLPWIDKDVGGGLTKEEWKGAAETNKILGLDAAARVPVDGLCVRVGVMRCHSQAFTIKLRRDIPLPRITDMLSRHNKWCTVVANDNHDTVTRLTPAAVSGSLQVHVGRLRKLAMGPEYLTAFTVGDQLLWGAAEPLRVTLRMLLDFKRAETRNAAAPPR